MFFATTNGGLKYNQMVISDTMDGAKQWLRNWWNDNYEEELGNFELAYEYYGFYVCEEPIKLNKPFDIMVG